MSDEDWDYAPPTYRYAYAAEETQEVKLEGTVRSIPGRQLGFRTTAKPKKRRRSIPKRKP